MASQAVVNIHEARSTPCRGRQTFVDDALTPRVNSSTKPAMLAFSMAYKSSTAEEIVAGLPGAAVAPPPQGGARVSKVEDVSAPTPCYATPIPTHAEGSTPGTSPRQEVRRGWRYRLRSAAHRGRTAAVRSRADRGGFVRTSETFMFDSPREISC
jgi:hypothetical protein